MSFVVPEEISMIVVSDPNAGAKNLSQDGSYFEISLEDGLKIPKDALNVSITVEESAIWWNIPNIITGVNDKMYITGPNINGDVVLMNLIIPQGLYDLDTLNQTILTALNGAGASEHLIELIANDAAQTVEIKYNYDNVSIDFNKPQTLREMVGFNAEVYGPYTAEHIETSPNVARFNQVNSFLIHSDLTNKGIRFNNTYNQVLSQILIDKAPGKQIVSKPYHPAKIRAQELAGTSRQSLRFWLTDSENRRVNTNGEYWSCRLVISYLKPYVIAKT